MPKTDSRLNHPDRDGPSEQASLIIRVSVDAIEARRFTAREKSAPDWQQQRRQRGDRGGDDRAPDGRTRPPERGSIRPMLLFST